VITEKYYQNSKQNFAVTCKNLVSSSLLLSRKRGYGRICAAR